MWKTWQQFHVGVGVCGDGYGDWTSGFSCMFLCVCVNVDSCARVWVLTFW